MFKKTKFPLIPKILIILLILNISVILIIIGTNFLIIRSFSDNFLFHILKSLSDTFFQYLLYFSWNIGLLCWFSVYNYLKSGDNNYKSLEADINVIIPWINEKNHRSPRLTLSYYSTSDLVGIAVFSSLGGILSTFVGYLGTILNNILGIPFGGGQILSGIHVFWIMFVYLLADRKIGIALITGIIKGFIEFFSGSAHGVLVIVLSGTQGLVIELFVAIFFLSQRKIFLAISAGLASLSNVIIQQLLFLNLEFLILVIVSGILSFISGFLLGGYLAVNIWSFFEKSTIFSWKVPFSDLKPYRHIRFIRASLLMVIVLGEISVFGALLVQNRFAIEVKGDVHNPYTYYSSDFLTDQITVEAELRGTETNIPLRNYTGVPLFKIIDKAQPLSNPFIVQLFASDGYNVNFNSTEIYIDTSMIIIQEDNGFRLVAGNFHGSLWIKMITRIEIKSI